MIAPGFEGVAEAFWRNFTERGDVGAAFAVYLDGQPVVDLWGGVADPARGRPWAEDTLQLVFSGTKGLAAACVLLLVERGQLELDAPAVRYWPDFGAGGKGAITVADILSHQARLPGVREPFDAELMRDPIAMAELLAAQPADPDPRAGFLYHAVTWGWLVAELVRRVDGRGFGDFFAAEFAGPLGLDAWIGLPGGHHHRVATTVCGPGTLADVPPDADPLRYLVRNPLTALEGPLIWNDPAFRRAELAAVGAHATARAMARFYACLAAGGELDGVRVLAPETVALGRRELRRGTDGLNGSPMSFGAGFELDPGTGLMGPAPDAFGHAGWGGSRHGAWPGARVGFSYTMNQIRADQPDDRPLSLLAATGRAVAASRVPGRVPAV